jgi:DNA-binding NarL/FixJ family response regulator
MLNVTARTLRAWHASAPGSTALPGHGSASHLDHLVLDRRLPDGDGLELLADLADRCPDVPVVVFTAHDEGDLPDGMVSVPESDLARLVKLLGRQRPGPATAPA